MNMDEIKELIEQNAEARASVSKALLEDLQAAIEHDAEVSAANHIAPLSPRQVMQLLLDADARQTEHRYGSITTVAGAWLRLEKYAPEYMESLTRKYERK